jgi:hypothetical protein
LPSKLGWPIANRPQDGILPHKLAKFVAVKRAILAAGITPAKSRRQPGLAAPQESTGWERKIGRR